MAELPTLLFCMGAAEAGNDWLRDYLRAHPDCHLRAVDELHYFDGLEAGNLGALSRAQSKLRDGYRAQLTAGKGSAARLRRQIDDRADWIEVLGRGREDIPAYLAYLTKGADGARLVGDLTPAYGLLPERRLRSMGGIAPDVRVIYLMRDPVERLWAHVRAMSRQRSPRGAVERQRTSNILSRTLAGEEGQIALRSDYRAAILRLRAAIDPDRLHFAFYEDLFEEAGLRRILDFLGLRWHAPAVGQTEYESRALEMLRDQRRDARAWLAPQYDYVAEAMGWLPEAWQTVKVRA